MASRVTNHPNRSRRRVTPAANPRPEDIRAARLSAGLDQVQAAALVYASVASYQRWEYGTTRMHPAIWELFQHKIQHIIAAHD